MAVDKFPGGTVGLIVSSTNENQQEDVFLHCDPRLVAVNVNGDPELGTAVYDLNGSNEYDKDRSARLQSLVRVIKRPLGTANALAWQLGSSGQSDTGGGYVIDDTGGGGGGYVISQAAADSGGPLDVGDGKCKHVNGSDADGNPITSLHITTNALFRKGNNTQDGPIRFEDAYEEGEDGYKVYPCHIGWTGGDWAVYVKVDIGPTPEETPDRRRRQIPSGGGRPTKLPWSPPWQPPWQPPKPSTDGGGRPTFFQPRGLLNPQLPFKSPHTYGGNLVNPTGQGTINQSMMESRQPIATSGLLARAQTSDRKKKDTAHMPSSAFNADAGAQAQFAETPVSGQMVAFGAQGGTVNPGTGYAESVGGSEDPWAYTKKPGKGRFYAGTVSGGWVFLPPEVQAGDNENGYVPDSISISTTYVLVGPGAYFGAGIPDTVRGGLQDGWSWGMDTSTGDLLFRTTSNSGDPTDSIKFELSSGDIYWKSGTSSYGRLAHANTTSRTYTFPDASGTLPVGTGSAFQVAVWLTTNSLTSDSGFTYDGASIAVGSRNIVCTPGGGNNFIWNEGGNNSDFRAEGENKVNNLLLDASDDEVAIDGRFSLIDISPSQITADQNDYNPESTATNRSSAWRLNSDASRTITGIANGLQGRFLIIVNVGSQNIILANENASSSATNRVITGTGGDITLAADDTAMLWYDSTTGRWRVIG